MDVNARRDAERANQSTNPRSGDLDHDQDSSAGLARSYTCGFCKRGFSNAQALGGHMNIHRKDRAKLRSQRLADSDCEDDDEISLSLDIKNTHQAASREQAPRHKLSEKTISTSSESTDKKICSTSKPELGNPRNVSDHHPGERKELPLLIEKDDNSNMNRARRLGSDGEEKKLRLKDLRRHDEDLDLELRLGLSPRKLPSPSSRSKTRTRDLS